MTLDRFRFRRMIRQQRGACYLCGGRMSLDIGQPDRATRDHVLPRSRGGPGTRRNIRAAHAVCNQLKGALTEEEFKALYPTPEALDVAKCALTAKLAETRRRARARKEEWRSEAKLRRRVLYRAMLADCF